MKRLTAEEGKVYTNGETYGKDIFLPDNADLNRWHQINEADIPSFDQATEADKDAAIARFGVEVTND